MKSFDTDWVCVFRWLAVWERFSVPARRHYLLAAQSHAATVSAEGYGVERELVLEAGLVEAVSTGRLKPTQASVPFRALMARLAKFPLFDQPWTHCETDEEKGSGRLLLYKRAMAGQILRIGTLYHRLEPQPIRFT